MCVYIYIYMCMCVCVCVCVCDREEMVGTRKVRIKQTNGQIDRRIGNVTITEIDK